MGIFVGVLILDLFDGEARFPPAAPQIEEKS